MEARNKSIESWFGMIEDGMLALPRFQRHESWRSVQVEGVLENVLRVPPLPIGALLTLEVGDKEIFHSRSIAGAPPIRGKPNLHLLDGQQRLTALWRGLHGNYENMTIFVSLESANAPDVQIVGRWMRKGVRQPVWADDPVLVFSRGLIPAAILRPGANGETALRDWCKAANVDQDSIWRIGSLRNRVSTYQIPFLALPATTTQETALDVFINMNTSATPLRDFDIVVAQVEEAVGNSLHAMIEELRVECPGTSSFGRIEDLALAVGALSQGKAPLKKTYLEPDFGKRLAEYWSDIKIAITSGVEFLQEECIFSEKVLPTEVALYLVCGLWLSVPKLSNDGQGRARAIIRKTLWRANFTDRYLKTAATRAFSDFQRIKALIENSPGHSEPELFDEEQNPLPSTEELMKAGWPSRKDRLARAVVAVSMLKGGFDFADGAKANAGNLESREFHHLFPVKSLGFDRDDPEIGRAINCALITWKTNRIISAKTPREYLKERAQDAHLGESEVRQRLESHFVPYDALMAGDYDAFLRVRADMVGNAMRKLCAGEVVS